MTDNQAMETTIDIVICLYRSSFMFSYQNKICSNIFQPLSQILLKNSQRVRLALIEFTSHNDNAPIKVHPFTSNAEKFQNSFQNLNASDESCSESRAIGEN